MMRVLRILVLCALTIALLASFITAGEKGKDHKETGWSWQKYEKNPVLGAKLGTCFDVSVLRENKRYRMWFSWRPKQSIALVESQDGLTWGEPQIVLGPRKTSGWEDDVNRPVVIREGSMYQMWYTGQAGGKSSIGYATSPDGKTWERAGEKPVLTAEHTWEKVAVMCPHVVYDADAKEYRMWYSGGEQYEPNAIGYATSPDGRRWSKHKEMRGARRHEPIPTNTCGRRTS